jgi:hypothetical protein
MEGGVGDHILAHRFAASIRDKYPGSGIHAFSDTENNPIQKDVLEYLYPEFYSSITIIPNKRYKKCVIDSQFGTEEYHGGTQNVPDEFLAKMIGDCDRFYNLHLDSLSFIREDYDWAKYFYSIPEPTIRPKNKWGKFIAVQLKSGSSQVHQLEQWYIDKLLADLSRRFSQYGIFIVSTEETNPFYREAVDSLSNVSLFNGTLKEVCDMVLCSSGFIGIDSAWRLLSYSKRHPTITLSKDCQGYDQVPLSHRLRWMPFRGTNFGLNYSTREIINLFEKMLDQDLGRLYQTLPELAFANGDVNSVIVNRKISLNLAQSL